MPDDRPYPSLAHAMAALDELPIAGAMLIASDRLGVDYDALVRARRLLPFVWPGDEGTATARLEGISMTPQGGLAFSWARGGGRLEMTIDPFSLYAFRLDTTTTTGEWTRATIEHAAADARSALGMPPLDSPATAAALGASGVTARASQATAAPIAE